MKRKKRGHLKKMALLMFLLLVACVGYFLVVNGVIHYSSKLKSYGIIKQLLFEQIREINDEQCDLTGSRLEE